MLYEKMWCNNVLSRNKAEYLWQYLGQIKSFFVSVIVIFTVFVFVFFVVLVIVITVTAAQYLWQYLGQDQIVVFVFSLCLS